jgi:hypothetical protein
MLLGLLGANLWATVVLVPALWAGTTSSRLLAGIPLFALAWALAQKRDFLLFGVFPTTLALCAACQLEATALLARPAVLGLAVVGLLAYLFVAARVAARAEAAQLPERNPTPLLAAEKRTPPGRTLFAFTLVAPVVFLWACVLRPGAAFDLATHHPDLPAAGALVICAAVALWTGLVVVYIRSALSVTGTQKRVRAEVWALRAAVHQGRPGILFYASVTVALIGMATLVYLRYR